MYNENSFKNHLFWIKVKRVFYMILFSIIGSGVGVFISSYVVDVLNFDPSYRFFIISGLTLLFFAISLLLTANTGKEVQDGYWKIEVLRKLTSISNKLDAIDNLDNITDIISQTKQALSSENVETNTIESKKEIVSEDTNDTVIENKDENLDKELESDNISTNNTDNKIINIENSKKINEKNSNEKDNNKQNNNSTDSNIEPTKKKHNNKKNKKRKKNKKIA